MVSGHKQGYIQGDCRTKYNVCAQVFALTRAELGGQYAGVPAPRVEGGEVFVHGQRPHPFLVHPEGLDAALLAERPQPHRPVRAARQTLQEEGDIVRKGKWNIINGAHNKHSLAINNGMHRGGKKPI